MAAPFVGLNQHFVGNDIKLFLDFALHVFAAGAAHHVTERAFVDRAADAFAGAGDHFDQQAQLGRNVAVKTLLLNQVARQGNFLGHQELQ